jgi:NADPH:quinone reductase-like Zn-dependent oxidoreductase
VYAASVNPADWHLVRGQPYIARLSYGMRKPRSRIPGCDVAGQVVAGPDVTTLHRGDEVFGSPFPSCGAFAKRVRVAEDRLVLKPSNLSFDHAAAVPVAALTALQGLRDHGRVEPGHKVLIIGASGGVGSFAVQIAKSLGADVTGVSSTRNLDTVRSLGADHVIDYTEDDVTEAGQRFDVILQVAGTRSPSGCRRALTPTGTLVQISGDSDGRWIGPVARVVTARLLSPFVSQARASFVAKPNKQDLQLLKQLIEAGTIIPVISRTYSLSEVPGAIRSVKRDTPEQRSSSPCRHGPRLG